MSKKVLIFKTDRGEYCVMNVPENYHRCGTKPTLDSPQAYPRYFRDYDDAVTEARSRHGHAALVIDETH